MIAFDEAFAAAVERMVQRWKYDSPEMGDWIGKTDSQRMETWLRAALLDPEGKGIELMRAALYGPCPKCKGCGIAHTGLCAIVCPICKGKGKHQILDADLTHDDVVKAVMDTNLIPPVPASRRPQWATTILAAAAAKLGEGR